GSRGPRRAHPPAARGWTAPDAASSRPRRRPRCGHRWQAARASPRTRGRAPLRRGRRARQESPSAAKTTDAGRASYDASGAGPEGICAAQARPRSLASAVAVSSVSSVRGPRPFNEPAAFCVTGIRDTAWCPTPGRGRAGQGPQRFEAQRSGGRDTPSRQRRHSHVTVSDTRPWDLPAWAEQPLESEELDPAADVEADAGDVRREVGAEKDDRIRDVLRLSGPPHRRALHHPLVHGGIAEIEGLGADHAWDDRVAGDAVPRALERQRSRQPEQ